jgi:AcrR family transcriptional regulator
LIVWSYRDPVAITSRGARSRQAIVTGAAELFAERGFAHVSVNDVAERVGLTKGAFYFHFATKEQLAQAVCASYHEWLVDLQRRVAEQEPEPLRRIPQVLLEAALAYRRDPIARGTTRLLEESNQLHLPFLSPLWARWWAGTLAEAQAAGLVADPVDVDRLAWTLTAAFYGTQSNSYAESSWSGLPARLADLLRFALLPVVSCPDAARILVEDLDRLAGQTAGQFPVSVTAPG